MSNENKTAIARACREANAARDLERVLGNELAGFAGVVRLYSEGKIPADIVAQHAIELVAATSGLSLRLRAAVDELERCVPAAQFEGATNVVANLRNSP